MKNKHAPLPPVLLVEPQFVLRHTIVSVARELGLVEFHEATNMARAQAALNSKRFLGVVLDMGDGPESAALLAELRKGSFICSAEIPVILMTSKPGAHDDANLKLFKPVGVLQKPFKIGELLQSVSFLASRTLGGESGKA